MTVNTSTHNHPNGGGGGGGDDESVDVQLPNLPGYRLTIPVRVFNQTCCILKKLTNGFVG